MKIYQNTLQKQLSILGKHTTHILNCTTAISAQKLDTEDKWDRENGIPLFWQRNFYPDVQMIANDLHTKGLIPAGEYVIDID